ncbi:DUF262 domain-containing protein [Pseudoalteromonas sp. Scap03]|uniref:DUF262 domain-containing protein n=1 Tax=unclassified Pseudoalteromonas TaxID=194690 RepID=UPI0015BB12D9|nr:MULTISPECIES: DUF262 domain-containing protein [unclassified Pseudoalteromonas]NWL14427.1 DUF262 domain-containing protein [Pseudoalteromonas sp. Scap03]QLE82440.1 DUF262 domain-containing protein [Pseudoalteromonas sp. Scap25]QLE90382.1 DUF262 domain-containing protein [Pseudoalteromonas sp. Scap06]
MSECNELELKPINDLLELSFFIPAYQRGYRWSKRQVTELLDDIKEFQQQAENSNKNAFYCLQPIVVKKHNSDWELVDGQQRLTTIYIILTYLKDILALLGKSRYQLSYETREESAEFLQDINEDRGEENIDFFHIVQAKKAVEEWFDAQDGTYKVNFIQTLLGPHDSKKSVQVIWYQIDETENVTEVFTRLNMGKIPLVNAELVKALFLKSSNFALDVNDSDIKKPIQDLQQLRISQEWDAIEKRLQDDAFWYFISNKSITTNRIEFVLDLASRNLNDEGILDTDKLKIFLTFNRLLSNSGDKDKPVDVAREWLKVKQCFMTLEEWYNDRALFHLIGYLVSQKVSISHIFELHQEALTKYDFRQSLLKLVFSKTFNGREIDTLSQEWLDERLNSLTYESGAHKLRPILLLFNVASLLANPATNARFQFDKYKLDSWDIEHIRSVASDMPNSKDKQKAWLENVVAYISSDESIEVEESDTDANNEELSIKLEAKELLLATNFNNDHFEAVYDKVRAHYDPDGNEDVDNSIGNLTLLDSRTNRSYQNAVFPIKRARIIALDKKATFVPLCTKNAFLKYYSKQVDKMLYWEAKDSEDHQRAMVEMLLGFFQGVGVHQKELGHE